MIDQYNVWLIYTRRTMIYLHLSRSLRNPKKRNLWIYERYSYEKLFMKRIFYFIFLSCIYKWNILRNKNTWILWCVTFNLYPNNISYYSSILQLLHVLFISNSRFNKSQANKCHLNCRVDIFLLQTTDNNPF